MKVRRHQQKGNEARPSFIGGDLAVCLFAGFIYYAKAAFEGDIFAASTPWLIIGLNLLRIILGYSYFTGQNAVFIFYVASNTIFLSLLEFSTPIYQGEYLPLYFLLVLSLAFYLDQRKTLIACILTYLGFCATLIGEGQFGIWEFLIPSGYFVLSYLFLRTFIGRFKESQSKLMATLDKLNQRTWELEMAQAETEMIYNTLADIAGTIDNQEMAQKILTISTKWLGAKTCEIFKMSPDRKSLLLIGEADGESLRTHESPKKVSILECLAFEDNGLTEQSSSPSKDLERGLRINKKRTIMFSPFVARGKAIGAILVGSTNEKGFSDSEEQRFMTLASSASLALDNAHLMKKTEELAIVDELTGMYNYRFFRDKLNTEIHRALRYKQELSVLMIDIDFFKRVNDTYGHQAGNLILQQLAGLLRRCVREVDILSRYGGEEFVVILPQTGENDAMLVGERIRREVESAIFECGSEAPEVHITVSIGVESFSDAYAKNTDQLLKQADRNLYAAKAAGRNRVICGKEAKSMETEPLQAAAPTL